MIRGEQYYITANVKQDDKELDIENIEKVIFSFDSLNKEYSENSTDVLYENSCFKIYLRQEETLEFDDEIWYQVTIKYKDRTILKTLKEKIKVRDSIMKEVV